MELPEEWVDDSDDDNQVWMHKAHYARNFVAIHDQGRGYLCPWSVVSGERLGQPIWNDSPEFWHRLSLAAIDISTKLRERADGPG
jgi:hypothetical protein